MPLPARRGPAAGGTRAAAPDGGSSSGEGLELAGAAAAAGVARRAWGPRETAVLKEEAADGLAAGLRERDAAPAAAAVEWTIDEVEDLIGLGKFQFFLLLIAGLGFAADCMEVTLMTFMGSGVSKEWGTHRGKELTTESALSWLGFAVFGGELAGCLFWGPAADRFGRQRAYLASCLLMLAASLASAVAPSFAFLLGARALVGFGIGGLAVPFDLLCEATPTKHRGTLLLLMEGFWVLGSIAVVALAWAVLASLGWRWLTALAALPILVAAAATLLLPESPRWLMERGRGEEAWAVLVKAAAWNGVDLPAALRRRQGRGQEGQGQRQGQRQQQQQQHEDDAKEEEEDEEVATPIPTVEVSRLPSLTGHRHHHPLGAPCNSVSSLSIDGGAAVSPQQLSQQQSQLSHPPSFFATLPLLLAPSLRRTTLWLWVIWFSFGLGYYGIVLYAAQLFSSSPTEAATGASFDFPPLLWSAASEGLGVLLALALLERWGRKGTQAATYLVAALGTGLMGLGSRPQALGLATRHRKRLVSGGSVVARVGAMAASSTTWVATPEAYPTAVRSTGHSVASAVARVGAILAPQAVGSKGSGSGRAAWGPAVILTAVSLLAGFAALMLPTETGGKALGDVDEAVEEAEELLSLQQSQSQSSSAHSASPLLLAFAPSPLGAAAAAAVVGGKEVGGEETKQQPSASLGKEEQQEEDEEMTLSPTLQQQQGGTRGDVISGEEDKEEQDEQRQPSPSSDDSGGSSISGLGSRKSSASSFRIKTVASSSSFGKVTSLLNLLGISGSTAAAAAVVATAASNEEGEEEKDGGIAVSVVDQQL